LSSLIVVILKFTDYSGAWGWGAGVGDNGECHV